VVVTHAEAAPPAEVEAIASDLRGLSGASVSVARHEWSGLTVHENGIDRPEPVEWLRGRDVLPVCAIGNPAPFLAQCAVTAGPAYREPVVLRDHDPYSPRTLDRVLAAAPGAGAVVTTEKDWSKLLRTGTDWPCPVARPSLELTFDSGETELLGAVLSAVKNPPA
jgi:tetraacyldisaccharide-1-P 4'-kinase